MINQDRLIVANKIIELILPDRKFSLIIKNNRLHLSYFSNNQQKLRLVRLKKDRLIFEFRRLLISHTEESAIGLLVRWIRNEKYGDISLWQRWAEMGLKSGDAIINILIESGYPKEENKKHE